MPKPCSDDLRERVIEAVETGASRREAAESFNLSASPAVKWLQRWRDTRIASSMKFSALSASFASPINECPFFKTSSISYSLIVQTSLSTSPARSKASAPYAASADYLTAEARVKIAFSCEPRGRPRVRLHLERFIAGARFRLRQSHWRQ
jgi:hypothetical protein